jgi:hypothetical protein
VTQPQVAARLQPVVLSPLGGPAAASANPSALALDRARDATEETAAKLVAVAVTRAKWAAEEVEAAQLAAEEAPAKLAVEETARVKCAIAAETDGAIPQSRLPAQHGTGSGSVAQRVDGSIQRFDETAAALTRLRCRVRSHRPDAVSGAAANGGIAGAEIVRSTQKLSSACGSALRQSTDHLANKERFLRQTHSQNISAGLRSTSSKAAVPVPAALADARRPVPPVLFAEAERTSRRVQMRGPFAPDLNLPQSDQSDQSESSDSSEETISAPAAAKDAGTVADTPADTAAGATASGTAAETDSAILSYLARHGAGSGSVAQRVGGSIQRFDEIVGRERSAVVSENTAPGAPGALGGPAETPLLRGRDAGAGAGIGAREPRVPEPRHGVPPLTPLPGRGRVSLTKLTKLRRFQSYDEQQVCAGGGGGGRGGG